jgi:hypothetical protein
MWPEGHGEFHGGVGICPTRRSRIDSTAAPSYRCPRPPYGLDRGSDTGISSRNGDGPTVAGAGPRLRYRCLSVECEGGRIETRYPVLSTGPFPRPAKDSALRMAHKRGRRL